MYTVQKEPENVWEASVKKMVTVERRRNKWAKGFQGKSKNLFCEGLDII